MNSSSQSKISDPVNLNPAQSSSLLKNVIDGKLKLKGKCQHLQVKNQNIQKNSQKIPSRKNSSGEGKNSVQNFSSKVIQENPVQKNKNLDQNFCNPVLPPFPDQKLKKPLGIDPFKFSTLTHTTAKIICNSMFSYALPVGNTYSMCISM